MIVIDADFFVYYCRKNGYAKNLPNDILGKKIRDIIEKKGGSLKEQGIPSYWDTQNYLDQIDPYRLCKNSSRYEIHASEVGNILLDLSQL